MGLLDGEAPKEEIHLWRKLYENVRSDPGASSSSAGSVVV